jgi:hypothetical protein
MAPPTLRRNQEKKRKSHAPGSVRSFIEQGHCPALFLFSQLAG